jgi:VWFA-related protein
VKLRDCTPVRRSPVVAAALACACVAGVAGQQEARQTPRFDEHVNVVRVLVDARVVDGRGRPVRDLAAADFRVRIDGVPARVESAQWVEGGSVDEAGMPLPAWSTPGVAAASSAGRLILFLFQKDLEPSRVVGLVRMLHRTRAFVAGFTAADRVAVASFDGHLKIWLDFTRSLADVDAVLRRAVLLGAEPDPVPSGWPSLLFRLPTAVARRTYSMEKVLLHLARAMGPLPGAKSLVIVGHGFGQHTGFGVALDREYGAAVRALQAGRVTVFALDTTDADRHSLEVGLVHVAEETGGFYDRTHLFSTRGLARLVSVLAGHYVLFVEQPPGRTGVRRLDVDLTTREGTVLAKRSFAR